MSVSFVLPYMFRSIPLTIFRGCSCCNATLRSVVFVTTLSGQPHAQIKLWRRPQGTG